MSRRLRVDWLLCDGHGVCAELFPEWIALDEWGYPVILDDEIPPALRGHARRAVFACPKLALRLIEVEPAAAASPGSTRRRARVATRGRSPG